MIGAVTTIAAQRLLKAGWKLVTGDEPPSPTDPDTPIITAMVAALGRQRLDRDELAAAASDRASATTAAIANVTCGEMLD